MGAATGLQFPPKLARTLSSALLKRSSHLKPTASKSQVKSPPELRRRIAVRAESKANRMEEASGSGGPGKRSSRLPLSEVVSDCVKRWFQDTLKEAKAGDSAMQVLIGQMYYNGYGINKDVHKDIMQVTLIQKVQKLMQSEIFARFIL